MVVKTGKAGGGCMGVRLGQREGHGGWLLGHGEEGRGWLLVGGW
jgi:hypothetical protein